MSALFIPTLSHWLLGNRWSGSLGRALLGKKAGDRVHIQVNDSYGYDVVIRNIEKGSDDGSAPLNAF